MTTANVISEVGVCNLALSRIGSTQQITSFTDGSNEAAQSALWYPQDRDTVLCDFPWPWAEAYIQLDQVAGPEINGQVANAQWARSYRYPADCLKLRRIVETPVPVGTSLPQTTGTFAGYGGANRPWMRAEGQPYPISYNLSSDATGRLIVTDAVGCGSGLTAVYTRAVADPSQFSADFVDALAWRLAADFAMGLAFSDSKRQWAHAEYEKHTATARATHLNEAQTDVPLVRYQSEMVRARWGG